MLHVNRTLLVGASQQLLYSVFHVPLKVACLGLAAFPMTECFMYTTCLGPTAIFWFYDSCKYHTTCVGLTAIVHSVLHVPLKVACLGLTAIFYAMLMSCGLATGCIFSPYAQCTFEDYTGSLTLSQFPFSPFPHS